MSDLSGQLSPAGTALAEAGIDFSPSMSSAPADHPTRVGDRGIVTSVNISRRKGTRKIPVDSGEIYLDFDYGVAGDAHAGDWHRQVSFLAEESIAVARNAGLDVQEGDFAENITTEGLDLKGMPVGTKVRVGEALVEISQIGKICHRKCAIYYLAGDCIFPREGIFGWVMEPGIVRNGDSMEVVEVGRGDVHRTIADKPL